MFFKSMFLSKLNKYNFEKIYKRFLKGENKKVDFFNISPIVLSQNQLNNLSLNLDYQKMNDIFLKKLKENLDIDLEGLIEIANKHSYLARGTLNRAFEQAIYGDIRYKNKIGIRPNSLEAKTVYSNRELSQLVINNVGESIGQTVSDNFNLSDLLSEEYVVETMFDLQFNGGTGELRKILEDLNSSLDSDQKLLISFNVWIGERAKKERIKYNILIGVLHLAIAKK